MFRKYVSGRGAVYFSKVEKKFLAPFFGAKIFSGPPLLGVFLIAPPPNFGAFGAIFVCPPFQGLRRQKFLLAPPQILHPPHELSNHSLSVLVVTSGLHNC